MLCIEMRWLGVQSSRKNAVFGPPAVKKKRSQIPLNVPRELFEGSFESSWIGEEIRRWSEECVTHRGEVKVGDHPPGWQRWWGPRKKTSNRNQ